MNEIERARQILDEVPKDNRFTWNFKQRSIASHIIKDNSLEDFLSWPESLESLHTGYVEATQLEREEIPEWMLAIGKDPDIGTPTDDVSPEGISGTFMRQLFILSKIEKGIAPVNSINRIIEFGGGYGPMAVLLKRLGFHGDHYVYDLPAVHILREWYLEQQDIETKSLLNPQLLLADIFISACALDEANTKLREALLDSVAARHYVFYFTKMWDGINNVDWFSDWLARNGMTPIWIDVPHNMQAMLMGSLK